MAGYIASDLYAVLEQHCDKVRKPRSTMLFRRGEKALGVFLVLRGTVNLDFGVDGSVALASAYGPGALVGLPATLTKGTYSMTAIVGEDAELGFLTTDALLSLLRTHPELCQGLLRVLSAKIAHTDQVRKELLCKERSSGLQSGVA